MCIIPFDTWSCDVLTQPFGNGRNDYSCFSPLIGRFGVYVVQEKNTGAVQYVGEAHAQDLKKRITQNFTEKNTGGTLRDNWCSSEGKDFSAFKSALADWMIRVICIETDSKELIRATEAILITALRPRYNK